MKLLLDQGLPRSSAALLRDAGIDTIHVGELDMSATTDDSIIDYSRSNGFTIVTLDADFHALIAAAGAVDPSVIRLRMERLKAPQAALILQTLLDQIGQTLESGCFVTVTRDSAANHSIRIRRLPIQPFR
jgi:predicted nuclease of predicted toxin-antitoxin system